MRRIGVLTAFVLALLCVVFTARAASKKPLQFVPDTTRPSAAALEAGVWIVNAERFAAKLTLLDTETRRKWLAFQTGSALDPFSTPPGQPPTFLTFLLDLECRGDGKIYFQPIGTRLIPPGGDLRNPLDVPTIHAVYGMLDKEMPPAYEGTLEKVLLQKPLDLSPGAKATGLLAFRSADLDARRFRLEVRFTGPNGEELGFDAPYVAVKVSDVPSGP